MPGSDTDFISTISQVAGNQDGPDLPDPFPNIPNPPENFDSEKNPIRTDGISPKPLPWAKKKDEPKYTPYAKVFVIDEGGNAEYNQLLKQGANGEIVLAKKEVADLKGAPGFKVYLEWMVPNS